MKALIVTVLLLATSFSSHSVVIRHDVEKECYLVQKSPEYLIDMPGEGHGVLIKPKWIVTVAHLIFADYRGKTILVKGQPYVVEQVIIHHNARRPDNSLFKGDAKPLMTFMKSTSDIALIKLKDPVKQVTPLKLYRKRDELGIEITAYGKGATGNGKKGSILESKQEKILRKMTNKIELAEGDWLSITLDQGINSTPLEGIDGSGDSGGPLIIRNGNQDYLVGLFSWDFVLGDLKDFKHGLYGGRSYQVRISAYVDWIERHTAL